MNLKEFAERELRLAGLFDTDSDYEGAIGVSVMELIELFANQKHSGFSAEYVLNIFNKLARFENLTPLSSNPDEWQQVDNSTWQSKRNPSIFSKDGGKTYYRL